jgi:hypothetical protein
MRNAVHRARKFGAIFERVRVYYPKKQRTLLGDPDLERLRKNSIVGSKRAAGPEGHDDFVAI